MAWRNFNSVNISENRRERRDKWWGHSLHQSEITLSPIRYSSSVFGIIGDQQNWFPDTRPKRINPVYPKCFSSHILSKCFIQIFIHFGHFIQNQFIQNFRHNSNTVSKIRLHLPVFNVQKRKISSIWTLSSFLQRFRESDGCGWRIKLPWWTCPRLVVICNATGFPRE